MGFLDILTGRGKKVKGPAARDRLFAMTTGYVTMSMELGLESTGKAAIVFQPVATADFDRLVAEMEELVNATGDETGTVVTKSDDTFGYRWMVLSDPDFEDLVVGINAVSQALIDSGYGDRVLAAVFSFKDAQGRAVYFIYNYKRGHFYPFVPAGGEQQRDNERELQLKAQLLNELPIEPDLERWFPLWGAPI
jgi:hypothetical protein